MVPIGSDEQFGVGDRNRLLRRVDWRFLLPDPSPRRTLCLADGVLGEGVRLICDHVDGAPVASGGEYDLAVVANPSGAVLRLPECPGKGRRFSGC